MCVQDDRGRCSNHIKSAIEEIKKNVDTVKFSFNQLSSSYEEELRDVKGELKGMKDKKNNTNFTKMFSIICYLSLFVNGFFIAYYIINLFCL